MPDNLRRRKAELMLHGLTQAKIAEALRFDRSTVSLVVTAKMLQGPAAQRIMGYVSAVTGKPVEVLWPETVLKVES